MPVLRTEYNILNEQISASSNSRIFLPLDLYSGTVTVYFEVVGRVTSGTLTVGLRQSGTTTDDATLTFTETSFTRKRVQATLTVPNPGEFTSYFVFMSGGTGPQVRSARFIVLQDFTTLTRTQAVFSIGNAQSITALTPTPLTSPKYFRFVASAWGNQRFPMMLFNATATAMSTKSPTVVSLQRQTNPPNDFSAWQTIETLNFTSLTPTQASTAFQSQVLDGCHYRVVVSNPSSKTAGFLHHASITIIPNFPAAEASSSSLNNPGAAKIQDVPADNNLYITGSSSGSSYKVNKSTLTSSSLNFNTHNVGDFDYAVSGTELNKFNRGTFTLVDTLTLGSIGQYNPMFNIGDILYIWMHVHNTIYRVNLTTWQVTHSQSTGNFGPLSINALGAGTNSSEILLIGKGGQGGGEVNFQKRNADTLAVITTSSALSNLRQASNCFIDPSPTGNFFLTATSLSETLGYIVEYRKSDYSLVKSSVQSPANGCFLSENSLFVVTPMGGVLELSVSGSSFGIVGVFPGPSGATSQPFGQGCVLFDSSGNKIYSTNTANPNVRRWNSTNRSITNLQTEMLLANTLVNSTGLADYDTLYDPNEWPSDTTFVHVIDTSTDTADSAKLQSDPNGTPADVTGSTATGANRAVSSNLTMPTGTEAQRTIDVNVLNTPIYASRILATVNITSEPPGTPIGAYARATHTVLGA